MKPLTSRERMRRFLHREPTDRIPATESFWPDTLGKWVNKGWVPEGTDLHDHFGLDLRTMWPFSVMGDLDFKEQIIEETADTKLVRNGNGALLRWWKSKAGTPEHVDFLVKDRAGWDEHIRPHLVNTANDRRRINFDLYRQIRQKCQDKDLFFCWSGVNVFECMHPVCGHEYMLMGMALEPDWVKDMCTVYADLTIRLMEILFAEEGLPDAAWFYEDMGFKERPFMSPAMYKDIVWPAHKKTFDYCHARGLKIIVHSCGFVEPLVPGLIEAGMDCLQAMEVKAGMDLVKLKKLYGDRICFMGGLDVRTLVANDRKAIMAELNKKLPTAMAGGGYCLHSDHSIPDQVDYATYKFFLEKGIEMGTYR
jgi:uroporphyrinogen decarboxylase